jgi:pimeloyl-ACP methyl ester carboxylesterase
MYGPTNAAPVLFLHGGFARSDYWGLQVEQLKSSYRCILMDSRGQGRSTMSSANITYDLMASDVIGLLDYLGIQQTHLVGWSDGAIIGLNIAIKYSNRLISLFAFAANYIPSGVKDVYNSTVFTTFLQRTQGEYETLNPNNNFSYLYNNLTTMWNTYPNWTQQDFAKINQNLSVWIVDADHEEAIFREQPDTMTGWIPQAGELILPRTSHFAFIQDPDLFTDSVARFLAEVNCSQCNTSTSVQSSADSIFHSLLFSLDKFEKVFFYSLYLCFHIPCKYFLYENASKSRFVCV